MFKFIKNAFKFEYARWVNSFSFPLQSFISQFEGNILKKWLEFLSGKKPQIRVSYGKAIKLECLR